ncbi:unnamed protein product [Pleuronectes platessa]|uniref:Uncharacterized protein n=1 Tax=Pleuronectes platessa TaxID=8262 RepID=A0A9N7YEF4_PLEPL|nr:unnamed protein product [Pleuronectes platessa]
MQTAEEKCKPPGCVCVSASPLCVVLLPSMTGAGAGGTGPGGTGAGGTGAGGTELEEPGPEEPEQGLEEPEQELETGAGLSRAGQLPPRIPLQVCGKHNNNNNNSS